MNIAVVLRQVPDLIETLEIAGDGTCLDYGAARFIVNEWDNHALEQALLLKESRGGSVTVVALDFGEVDNTLYEASAKGADNIVKIPWDADQPPALRQAVALYAEVLRSIAAELILVGCQAHDELEGPLAPQLAFALKLPYVGVVRGVQPSDEPGSIRVFKEFPGAVVARMAVRLPALIGILAAEKAPRYVPVSRIRAAMKSTQIQEQEVSPPPTESLATVSRLYVPEAPQRAEMLEGSVEEVAERLYQILAEKGLVR
jgi:electron transfer flavoprotein beta subunit